MTRRELFLGAIAGLFLAVHFATWISSLEYTTVASSVVLVSTGPLWVALVSPFFLREQLRRTALLGLGLAILGGVIIGGADACRWDAGIRCVGLDQFLHGRAIWGNFLALMGAWAVSGYLVVGRRLRASVPLVPYILVAYGSAALCLLVAMLVFGQSPFGLKPTTYFWILLLAIVPQLIGHSTYNWALGFLPAALGCRGYARRADWVRGACLRHPARNTRAACAVRRCADTDWNLSRGPATDSRHTAAR